MWRKEERQKTKTKTETKKQLVFLSLSLSLSLSLFFFLLLFRIFRESSFVDTWLTKLCKSPNSFVNSAWLSVKSFSLCIIAASSTSLIPFLCASHLRSSCLYVSSCLWSAQRFFHFRILFRFLYNQLWPIYSLFSFLPLCLRSLLSSSVQTHNNHYEMQGHFIPSTKTLTVCTEEG